MNTAGMFLLLGAFTGLLQAEDLVLTPGAEILSPQPGSLESPQVEVAIRLPDGVEITWDLRDLNRETGVESQLAAGAEAPNGAVVFVGQLEPGHHRLSLEFQVDGNSTLIKRDFAVSPECLPGWPLERDLHPSAQAKGWMPECRPGETVALRSGAAPGRQQSASNSVEWLDGTGAELEGWPMQLNSQGFQLSEFTNPLMLETDHGSQLLLLGDSEWIKLGADAHVLQHRSFDGFAMGAASMLHDPDFGLRLLLPLSRRGTPHLVEFDSDFNELRSHLLPGQPALPGLLLADFSGDGRTDVALALDIDGDLQILYIDGLTGEMRELALLSECSPAGWVAGDLDRDHLSDLVLSDRFGRVWMIDRTGIVWEREFPVCRLSAPGLGELFQDGRDFALLALERVGLTTELLVLDGAGLEVVPLSRLVISDRQGVRHAPQFVEDESGRHLIITALAAPESEPGAACIRAISPDAQIVDSWYIATDLAAPPRIEDLNADGLQDLVLVDGLGRLCAWNLDRASASPPHPLGDVTHSGRFVQPVSAGSEPQLLSGRVRLEAGCLMPPGQQWVNLDLLEGELDVRRSPHLTGPVHVARAAGLLLGSFGDWSGTEVLQLKLDGRCSIIGSCPDDESPMDRLSDLQGLLERLEIELGPGAVIELERCRLDQPVSWLQLEQAQRLVLKDSWVMDGCGAITLDHAYLDAEQSLLQGGQLGVLLENDSRARLTDCIVTSADSIALLNRASTLELKRCTILTSATALLQEAGASCQLDSVHFQGNDKDLVVEADGQQVSLAHCDFVESSIVSIENLGAEIVLATHCYWESEQPALGLVDRSNPLATAIVPAIVPAPVFEVGTGPMVDGDEPLEWDPVEVSMGGIPIQVSYTIYRSVDPYDLVRPENRIGTTSQTWFLDEDRPGICFYCVTASIGKEVVD